MEVDYNIVNIGNTNKLCFFLTAHAATSLAAAVGSLRPTSRSKALNKEHALIKRRLIQEYL
jgi:hypothetical protein